MTVVLLLGLMSREWPWSIWGWCGRPGRGLWLAAAASDPGDRRREEHS